MPPPPPPPPLPVNLKQQQDIFESLPPPPSSFFTDEIIKPSTKVSTNNKPQNSITSTTSTHEVLMSQIQFGVKLKPVRQKY